MTSPGDPVSITLGAGGDHRLGRHRWHDPRSRAFNVRTLLPSTALPVAPVTWVRHGALFDQGACPVADLTRLGADPTRRGVGCCTMCAAFGLFMTEPFYRPDAPSISMSDVLDGYHAETVADDPIIPGIWPPVDPGGCGLAAMKVLQGLGLIASYAHAFSLGDTLAALAAGPLAVGTRWYSSMFAPVDRDGRAVLEIGSTATVVGGHEYVLDRIDPVAAMVGMTNSWGASWGSAGTAWMSYDTLARLLDEGGDAVMPVLPVR